jgi:hypothetical protein
MRPILFHSPLIGAMLADSFLGKFQYDLKHFFKQRKKIEFSLKLELYSTLE